MYNQINYLSRRQKKLITVFGDLVITAVCVFLAFLLFDIWQTVPFVPMLCVTLAIGLAASALTGTHQIVLRTLNPIDLQRLLLHAIILSAGFGLAKLMFGTQGEAVTMISFGFSFITLTIVARVMALSAINWIRRRNLSQTRVVIYGAGSAGQQLHAALCASNEARPIAFFDDNPLLHGSVIAGQRVRSPEMLDAFIKANNVEKILVAIPSISRRRRAELVEGLKQTDIPVLELPPYNELIAEGSFIKSLRQIDTSQLLSRDVIDIDLSELKACYAGRVVMVTGAGGSIGSELCRQIILAKPRKLILFEMCEYALYAIDMELRRHPGLNDIELVTALGSVCDRPTVAWLLERHKAEIVLHAAAYKHVPLIEDNPLEAGRNNVLGTQVVATECMAHGVARFILISTDKAVRPANVMGASKRLAELVIQDLQTRSETTRFAMVRFGNVLGSSGSVIPLFRKQIEEGGPITVTDPSITRYFMIIPEAARLVLVAGTYAEQGEVFVLDMGAPVKIDQLARKMIALAGLSVQDEDNPNGDISIVYTGLRPGEKMYEELFVGSNMISTPHPKIMRAIEAHRSEIEIANAVRQIRKSTETMEPKLMIHTLEQYVDGFGTSPVRAEAHRRPSLAELPVET